ncbi:MAG: hypothetical protein PUE80_05315 [bacterium]|nr:hypothetical protein [bacterium]MDD6832566.1 hypothetical protein [bacterium]MDD6901076.1 hypothetical protein [bacterium]MDY4185212.1 hypothetical protein [Sodaliphilus sp.]
MRHYLRQTQFFFGGADFLFSSIPLKPPFHHSTIPPNPIPPNLTKSSSRYQK